MTFVRPTLEELIARADAEVASRLGLGPLHRRSVVGVFARVMAGLVHSAHGHVEHAADQIFPTTADAEHLERHASLRGIVRKAATFATGPVTFRGTEAASVPAGTGLSTGVGGAYETTTAAVIGSDGTGTATVEAVLPGAAGNQPTGTPLTLQTAIPGIVATATSGEVSGGTDEETDEELRARVLASWRARPMAGTAEDYITWALEVPGITRAWVAANTPTLGQVTIRVVADNNTPTILPTSGQLAQVQGYIDARRPVTARASVVAPVLDALDLTLRIVPGTAAVRAAALDAIADWLGRDAAPGGTLRRSRLSEALASVPGQEYHEILIPTGDVVASPGELPTLGVVTWA